VASISANLLGMPRGDLEKYFLRIGERPYRAKQLMRWLYNHSIIDPELMTDLSVQLRNSLRADTQLALPKVSDVRKGSDGTIKWLLDIGGGQQIETVYIPEPARDTLCVSSQAGCAIDCSFCATGKQGFNRNLSAAEIIGQVVLVQQALTADADARSISNVVFMGMGEPLANFREVVRACDLLTDDMGFGLSRRRVTVSTSGLVPQIRKLAAETNVALAVSLHASSDAVRNELVPINRRHPIGELLAACWYYARATRSREITFEYVMLENVNDSCADAERLASLLRDRPAKVNLIPFNAFPGTVYRRSSQTVIDRFRQVLLDHGIMTITRKTRGDDIDAACGQLAGRISNRVRIPLATKTLHTVTHR
jgi:23S rRNA (adenine2503-C2)-methyltransferase